MNDTRKQLQANLNGLQIDEARLPQLENIGGVLEQRQQSFLQLGQRIDKEVATYPDNREQFVALQQQSEKLGFWTRTTLMLFALMLLTGLFLLLSPEQWVSGMSENLRETLGKATIRIAAVIALVGAVLLIYGWFVDARRLRPLRLQANRLADTLLEGFDVTNTLADQQLDQDQNPEVHDAARYLLETQTDIPAVSSDHPDIAVLPEWAESVRRYELSMNNLQGAADALNISMETRNREFGRYLQVLNSDKAEQVAALNQREQYQAQLDQQEMALEHIRRDRVVFDTALDLLQRSGSQSVVRFNQLVQQRCRELLQRFTNGHYHTLELMPDFSLKVLSEQKGAYLDFIETSAGTQRQIALAMRVAVAAALADNTHTTHQVLFLDEPLAFFDPERSLSTLQSLQSVSQSAVSQVWLTAQTVPEGVDFARVIHCPQVGSELHA
jgi:exonuclease SbcC